QQLPEETVNHLRVSFARSPKKSTRRASKEFNIQRFTAWKVLRKILNLRPYRLQLLQALSSKDKVKRY
ncbi:hypothetical protein C0J52_23386, partial [Blattella germanica]